MERNANGPLSEDVVALMARHNYALVNMHHIWPEPWHEGLPLTHLIRPRLKDYAIYLPALISLAELTDEQREWLAKDLVATHLSDRFCGSLIGVPKEVEQERLHQHFISLEILTLQVPKGEMIFRLHDPRVLAHVPRLFSVPQVRQIFGPVTSWVFPYDGCWYALEKPEAGVASTFFGMRTDQAGPIFRLGDVNATLRKVRHDRGKPWRDLGEIEKTARTADEAVMVAQSIFGAGGMAEDIVEFAFQACTFNARFYEHPYIKGMLAEVLARKLSWRETTLMRLCPQDWARLAA